ncbi:ATP-dependent RNA helicase, putative [Trypanosoma brucei brucei TREU927]|uniref:ATP-dependent RNA helicase, putative n=1 Tax=Trypanosoma brucei brucei (strain 927/4 GUTat10.1) TaxID=185431 RepID=Q385X9_TRYB2|nr:ATP-dependent RNA helicase, putative [Trypanosoma brucei brucei TREU927]EAN79402.1 ATP-dependent RNA helicase, putative [Trypanosoma brucei brucei TREU927]
MKSNIKDKKTPLTLSLGKHLSLRFFFGGTSLAAHARLCQADRRESMSHRGSCMQCGSFDEGAEDPRDRQWYCNTCWAAYNDSRKKGRWENREGCDDRRNNIGANHRRRNPNAGSRGATETAGAKGGSKAVDKQHRNKAEEPERKGSAASPSWYHSAQDAVRRLESVLGSFAPFRQDYRHHLMPDATSLLDDLQMLQVAEKSSFSNREGEVRRQHTCSFVGQFMQRHQSITVIAHTGEPLSPRGNRVGGVSRSAYLENNKVSLDLLLSSVDDIVSQVYVRFDEDMTRIILNALDRVTACETQKQRDAVRVRAIEELLQVLGVEHCELIQCVMHRPRDIFLRLLEEFCTLDGGNDGGTTGDSAAPDHRGLTVRFVKTAKQRSVLREAEFDRRGSADEQWLAHMTQRYRQLVRESELDEFFKRDLSINGSCPSFASGATVLQKEDHIRVHVPPPERKVLPEEDRVCIATSLPEWTHAAFLNITHLNTIQTSLFRTAFHTSQNMLVCAPTGAGKTVCGLLVMLRCIEEQRVDGVLDRNFKIIFIAPMKALAQEMVENFSRRLAPFAMEVRELTGDMQLTKRELAQTQVIVTTPEKWDVITRKQANEELTTQVRLIIIDEIHLLNEDRGPVLEAIVARTLRQGELASEQKHRTRLVGLSATLPNYKDVANFLRVDLAEGLKVFGAEYRPVPLEQSFIGLRMGLKDKERRMDQLAYEEVVRNVREGHQVMVFVHSRKQTVALARFFMEEANVRGHEALFKQDETVPKEAQKLGCSLQGRDLSNLFAAGFGAHHAGLIRYDRTSTENLFRKGFIRVLVCTSTLAWGVNLPAHSVMIRGTHIYDPKRGGLVSMSVLDVMQIFGRAGRPQYDTSGHGTIISDEKEVGRYLRLLACALPIESKLQEGLCDHLNAEIHAGTISSIVEGSGWLEYTYLWQRLRVNPLMYGLKVSDARQDPKLKKIRYEIVSKAAEELADAGMIRYNPQTGAVDTTDLGRIASHYYISYKSIATFNTKMRRPDESWIDSLDLGAAMNVVACADEFSQLRVRQEELDELKKLHALLPRQVQHYGIVGESADETSVEWKVTTLMKSYISRINVDMHSLASDVNYVVQNAPRISRSLFEIEMQRGHPLTTAVFLSLCKCLEQRRWEFEHPLLQFGVDMTDAVYRNIEKKRPSMSLLQEMSASDIGSLVQNQRFGDVIARLVASFPTVSLAVDIQPITCTILRVKVTISATFSWNSRYHGSVEPFWLLVEDQDNHFIFHHELISLKRKEVEAGLPQVVNLSVPIVAEYDMYSVRLYSDRWLGSQEEYSFSIGHLHLPDDSQKTTPLLPLAPLRREVIPEKYHTIYESFREFNPVQTQVFHAMYHTDSSIFLGAPTGSGKTIAAEMSILRLFEKYPVGSKVVYIAPLKALVKERVKDWMARFSRRLGRRVLELSGDVTPDITALVQADILCTTPEKWDGLSRSWQVRRYVTAVRLVIFDEIHMLGSDRGPILEVIVSRMRFIGWHRNAPIRLIGLSTAVANPADLTSWLGVSHKWAVFNFDPSVRPVPMRVHIAGYHGRNYCPRMAAMNKPVYNAICEKSPNKPVIVFVSSRRQTRLTAMALIGFLVMEQNTAKFVRMDVEEVNAYVAKVSDPYVKHCMQFGVGVHHAGLLEGDRTVVESAFLKGKLQVLVATSTLAWGVNFPAHMVVVKGTEYYDGKTKTYVDFPITDVLQMIGRAGRPQFDTEGVAQVLCHEPKKGFYRKFLYDPFPVESALHRQLHTHINAEIVSGTIKTRQDAVDYLTWTYMFRRIVKNPSYYGLSDRSPASVTIFMSTLVANVLDELEQCGCIEHCQSDGCDADADPNALTYTVLGKLCSYYYLSHKTVYYFDTNINENSTHVDVLKALCEADEFEELPVRHNEDKLNLTLSQALPLPIKANNADSPHVKAFLLFQAHFERCNLPISDYYTDQKSTLDNAMRVVQAMVDITANNGHLHTSLRCMSLLQCIVQGLWWHSNTLLQIPHVTDTMLPIIAEHCAGLHHVSQLVNSPLSALTKLHETLCDHCGLGDKEVREAMEAVRSFPLIDVHIRLSRTVVDDGHATEEVMVKRGDGMDDDEEGDGYELTAYLTRLSTPIRHVVAPHFTKSKDEQYWLVIGSEHTGELIAMKRVGRLMGNATTATTLRFDWDDDWTSFAENGSVPLSLYVVCDSYVGLDQQYNFRVSVPSRE